MPSFFDKLFSRPLETVSSGRELTDGPVNIQIATCAVLLEVARADDDFSADERKLIVETLAREFSLAQADVEELLAVASQKVDDSIDTWGFTNTLNRNLSVSEKIKIIEIIWRVIYSDDHLSHHEDALVHKLSFLLALTHDQLIAAKLKARPL
jgi:uncharacterized tellurite resistance protein B-like protein